MQSTIKRNAFTLGLACILSLSLMGLLPAIASAATVATKTVTYLPGATDTTGAVPVDPTAYGLLDPITVMDPGTLARPGYTFAGWKPQTDFIERTYTHFFPVVSGAPADVVALGPEAVAQFMDEYGMWVELYTIDSTVADVSAFPLLCRLKVQPGGSDLIGHIDTTFVPAGDYYMRIFRPGFMLRWSVVTCDGFGTGLVEKFDPEPGPYTVTALYDGTLSVPSGGESVIDVVDAYCLVAGDVNADMSVDGIDVSYAQLVSNSSPHVMGGILSGDFYWTWSEDRNDPFWATGRLAWYDYDGDGWIDPADIGLILQNFMYNMFFGTYRGAYPAARYFYTLGLLPNPGGLSQILACVSWGMTQTPDTMLSAVTVDPFPAIEAAFDRLYQPGEVVNVPGNIVFVAQWTPVDVPPKPPGPGGNGEKPGPGIPAAGDGASLTVALLSGCAGVSVMLSASWLGLSRRRRCKR